MRSMRNCASGSESSSCSNAGGRSVSTATAGAAGTINTRPRARIIQRCVMVVPPGEPFGAVGARSVPALPARDAEHDAEDVLARAVLVQITDTTVTDREVRARAAAAQVNPAAEGHAPLGDVGTVQLIVPLPPVRTRAHGQRGAEAAPARLALEAETPLDLVVQVLGRGVGVEGAVLAEAEGPSGVRRPVLGRVVHTGRPVAGQVDPDPGSVASGHLVGAFAV